MKRQEREIYYERRQHGGFPISLRNTDYFRTFETWKLSGYRIRKGERARYWEGRTPYFGKDQVWRPEGDHEDSYIGLFETQG